MSIGKIHKTLWKCISVFDTCASAAVSDKKISLYQKWARPLTDVGPYNDDDMTPTTIPRNPSPYPMRPGTHTPFAPLPTRSSCLLRSSYLLPIYSPTTRAPDLALAIAILSVASLLSLTTPCCLKGSGYLLCGHTPLTISRTPRNFGEIPSRFQKFLEASRHFYQEKKLPHLNVHPIHSPPQPWLPWQC